MVKDNICIIDGDTIIYLACYNKKDTIDKSYSDIIDCLHEVHNNIMQSTESKYYCGLLTSPYSFKYEVAKTKKYKDNRKDAIKPKYFQIAKAYLLEILNFEIIKGYEADDICTILNNRLKVEYNTIICSPDKDLKQVEGNFFDYRKGTSFKVDKEQALYNLWKQVLTGDASDNILGIEGIGDVKASKLLDPLDTKNFPLAVLNLYINTYGEYEGISRFHENYNLVKCLEKELDNCPVEFKINEYIKHDSILDF